MSISEKIRELDREVGDRVERALAEFRRELTERLRRGTEEILQRVEDLRPNLPGSLLGHAIERGDLSSAEESVRSGARQGAVAELRDALAGIDRARSQAEVLRALLAASAPFSSRAALLLVREGALRGWGARGFAGDEGAVREVVLGRGEDGAWGRVGNGGGAVRLSAADSAALCSRLESPLPQDALLVPMVLRDRVAAALYADRTEGGELGAEALQILAYVAAQAIETLPFRERSSTPTLEALDRQAPVSPTPEAVQAGESAGAAAATAPPETPEPAMATAASEIAEPEPAPAVEEAVGSAAPVPDLAEEPAAEPPDLAIDLAARATLAEEPGDSGSVWGRAEPAEPAEPDEPPIAGRDTVLLQRPAGVLEPIPSPFAPPAPPPPDTEPEAAEEPPPAVEPVARLRPVGFAPEPEEPRAGGGTVEVQPPSGVQGPGWAFATTRVPVSPDEESLHDEARRLARLLVSEIKLYNEDQVEEGRRNRDLYERLKEDIDRSRQMYEERVDPRLLRTTDYFYQELVRILAAGDSKALGI